MTTRIIPDDASGWGPEIDAIRDRQQQGLRGQVERWLLDYAWNGTPEEQAAEVACIMAQDGWQFVDAQAERFAAQAEVPGPEAFDDAHGFALSALYECHGGPHIAGCPSTPSQL